MSPSMPNKYRVAMTLLTRGREQLVEEIADEILDRPDLLETPYLFNEFLENQGTRLHFLSMLVAQLEQTAEQYEEAQAATVKPPKAPAKPAASRSRSGSKKLAGQQATGQQRKRNADEG